MAANPLPAVSETKPVQFQSHKLKDRESASVPAARLSSEGLLGPAGKAMIEHRGEVYVLRCTRSGKLILTK